MTLAHVYRSGQIVFRRRSHPCPQGALPLPDVPGRVIRAKARLAHDGKTLLVPGVPEAVDGEAAIDAVLAFCNLVNTSYGAGSQLTPRQRTLLVLLAEGPRTATALAGTENTPGMVVLALKKLRKRGLVATEDDRPSTETRWSLTPTGREAVGL